MTRTFCTTIDDATAHAVLWPYGEVMAKARHWSFKQVHVLHRSVTEVKKEAQSRFGITARQFNGVRFDLDQAVNAWRGTAEFRVGNLRDSIEATVERIAAFERRMKRAKTEKRRASLRFQSTGKKQRLDVLRGRLGVVERELIEGRPRICFGGRAALRFGDVAEWRARRASRILLVGSKGEANGNQSVRWDGSALTLRLPDALGGGYTTLSGVLFRYGQKELLAALERNKNRATRSAMTWLLFLDDDNRWHAHVTLNEPVASIVTSRRNGVVAVDVNVGHLAVTVVDQHGNPTSRLTLAFPESGTDEGRASVVLGDSVRALVTLAKSRGYAVACEELEFSRKKAGLREYGAAHARRLSGWGYARFFKLLSARCARDGVELTRVNPAYTSVIGKMKYARCRAMTTHHAAALVIGRAAAGYGDRLVCMDGSALDAPARMRPRTERRRWRGVCRDAKASSTRRLAREAGSKASAVRTARSGAGEAETGGRAATQRPAAGVHGVRRRSTATAPPQVGDAVALATRVSPHG